MMSSQIFIIVWF